MSTFLVLPFNLFMNEITILLISDLLISLVVVAFVLNLFSFNRYVLSIVFSIFVIANAIFFYMDYFLGVSISLSVIMAIVQTNSKEAVESLSVISYKSIPIALVFVILPIYLSFKFKLSSEKILDSLKEKLGLLFIFILLIFISLFTNLNKLTQDNDPRGVRYIYLLLNINTEQYPINWVYNTGKYFSINQGNFTFSDIPTKNKFSATQKNQPFNIVLVIGETARSDRFSLGGYKRKTNPLLEKRENLVFFNNFYSCYNMTIPSVSCLLGFKKGKDFVANLDKNLTHNVESFVPIFKNANFDTFLISSNSYKPRDPMFQRIKEINSITYLAHSLGNKDEDLIPLLQKIIDTENKNKPNKLIILHTMGSHYKYSARYPEEFQKWSPICSSLTDRNVTDCDKKYLDNEYDNTILYTDHILNEIMNVLNNTNSILIYVSDHGESLGETYGDRTFYNHGTLVRPMPVEQRHIPAILWFSDMWIKNFGDKQLNNARAKKNKTLNHDFISYSMLDCAFIESKFIDKSLSLCSPVAPKTVSTSIDDSPLPKNKKK
jgi:glucan phosphoethanolaminetransferase (alkaline phosphatase superfamily)